ncbi:hypothetical protein BGS_0504 [Beggiatoa sp. SS]|nr:hypothetical protein BGS_0504 [Beggiatoa sp. SS]
MTGITQTTPFYFETFHHYGGTIGADTAPDTGWFSKTEAQLVNCDGSPTSPQSGYDAGYKAGYEAGMSACQAAFSPTNGIVHFPCVDVPTEAGIVRYKVDMKLMPDSDPLLFSVIGVVPHVVNLSDNNY